MDRAEIVSRLKAFLESEFPNQGVTLGEETHLLDEWFVDSLGIVETVMFLETEFGLEISRADINGANFENVASLARFVTERLAAAS